MPVLVEEASGLTLPEASIIIEYLDTHHPGPDPMLPSGPELRLEVRLMDRFFDNYLHASLQKIVGDRLRDPARSDAQGVEQAHTMLDTCYSWLDTRMADRQWAVGDRFTLADSDAHDVVYAPDGKTIASWKFNNGVNLSDAADGTLMTLRNRGRPAGFSKLLAPIMATAIRRANRKDLARLKALLESI